MRRHIITGAAMALLAGCATAPRPVPVAAVTPAPPPPVVPTLPAGATPGMLVPAALPDGSYPTPNQHLSTGASLWHLRAGLNVAALSCPAADGAAITAAYNAMLVAHAAELKTAEASYAAEYRAASAAADWRDRYDDAMTRLYNFFSQTPVRPAFCAAARGVADQLAGVPAGGLSSLAVQDLAALDQPFVAFYRAYDAWRRFNAVRQVIAVSAAPAAGATASPASAGDATTPAPRLQLDMAALPSD